MIIDTRKRALHDLRISVTDRCNFRCDYCMPANRTYHFMPKPQLLTFEEIIRLARIFAELGVRKLRITGGEPLLRRDLPQLIAGLTQVEGIEDIALTTNGFFLAKQASALKEAGLKRVTVSLDSLDPKVFAELNGRNVKPDVVLKAMDAAKAVGLGVKVNAVIQRGINDYEVVAMAKTFREMGHVIRFIEFMDVGNVNGWKLDRVVPAHEIVQRINETFPCVAMDPAYSGEVARRYRYEDGRGEFGMITSVTAPFCGQCSRARLSADGELYTCLFASKGFDLKKLMRDGESDQSLSDTVAKLWGKRDDRYSEIRSSDTSLEKVEMFKIGG